MGTHLYVIDGLLESFHLASVVATYNDANMGIIAQQNIFEIVDLFFSGAENQWVHFDVSRNFTGFSQIWNKTKKMNAVR